MHDGFHPPIEEYLEAICELEEEGVPVIQARLAERLDHAPPSVSEMIKRLRDEGYVEMSGREVHLTVVGRTRAESVVRKHRLAERLLTDVIGLPWHKSHVEACRWEHVISDEVEARLVILLENPNTCPHGNPIPGTVPNPGQLTALTECEIGARTRLARVTERVEIDMAALEYLDTNGFRPGAEAIVEARADDGSMTLRVGDATLELDEALAEQLFVAVD